MFYTFIEDGTYEVVGFSCVVSVTGNAGIIEYKNLRYKEIIIVKNGVYFFGARWSIQGEILKLLNAGYIKKLF